MKSRTAAATSFGCSSGSMWLPPLISCTSRLGNPFERSAVPSAEVTMLSAPRRTNVGVAMFGRMDRRWRDLASYANRRRLGGVLRSRRTGAAHQGWWDRCGDERVEIHPDKGVEHGCGNRRPRVRDEARRRERTRRVGEDGVWAVHQTRDDLRKIGSVVLGIVCRRRHVFTIAVAAEVEEHAAKVAKLPPRIRGWSARDSLSNIS